MDDAEWQRAKAAERLNILDAILRALDDWAAVHAVVSRCSSRAAAVEALGRAPFGFSPVQALFVLDTPLGLCTDEARQELLNEAAQLRQLDE